jgi:hypothetical protein
VDLAVNSFLSVQFGKAEVNENIAAKTGRELPGILADRKIDPKH